MRVAGIRETRQNLTALIEEVRKGHEVTITDRGRPVARLVPPRREAAKPFAGRAVGFGQSRRNYDARMRAVALHVGLTTLDF